MTVGHAAARWIVGLAAAFAVLGIAAIAAGQPQSPEPLDAFHDWDAMRPSLAGAFAKQRRGPTIPSNSTIPSDELTAEGIAWMEQHFPSPPRHCTDDFDGDGSPGTDRDIEAFLACLAGSCCRSCPSPDFNGDGDPGTDADIEAFLRVLAGDPC